MTGAGLSRGMRLIARGKHRTVLQPCKSPGEMTPVLREQIGGKLIDRDRHHQPRSRGGGNGRGLLGSGFGSAECRQCSRQDQR